MKSEIITKSKHDRPFSSGIETESLVFVSGQGGLDPITGQIVGTDIESQTIQTLENMRAVLLAADLDLNDLVKVNVYLKDRSLYNEFNEVFGRYFQAPYPSRTAIYCDLNFDLLVEIDGIAVKRK
ncbi:reactive intermediate/imine deaminase [Paenibacillus sp. FSL H8-0548]|uniref:RidA family protein n=1 Tax=Paenibacillus sp. FSL H8-0548 TaxID=1920422 RepID=UPI00096EBDAF|nr:Rid family hydrolase [Paenibacillus sp. FSL H8-0548]OMF34657.1 reactive intermediate/imine deaminase [Paenibacillus sp. FSL H8-0548]